jgi:hypothetical protein
VAPLYEGTARFSRSMAMESSAGAVRAPTSTRRDRVGQTVLVTQLRALRHTKIISLAVIKYCYQGGPTVSADLRRRPLQAA